MKNLLSLLFITVTLNVFSQLYNFDFETEPSDIIIYRDTISNPNCIWQIGQPNKTTFTSAYSGNNVIVTDTINTYPINDTSSFIIKYKVGGGFLNANSWNSVARLSGRYKVQTDTLNDFCKIEFSPNNGMDWVLISEDTASYIDGSLNYWPSQNNDLTLTGNVNNWETFEIYLDYGSHYLFNIEESDTIQYKFTIISDNNSENMDGIMFDDISVIDEGTDFLEKMKFLPKYTPTHSTIHLKFYQR
jgi:hypothetical protein